MIPLKDTIPSRSFPIANTLIIGTNLFVFLLMVSIGPTANDFVRIFGLIPYRFIHEFSLYQVFTVFSSMFLHGGWFHFFSNMLALYIFGDNVEDRLGSVRYLFFYLTCGIGATLVHIFFNPGSTLPTIGASGAISGVLAAYFILFPTSTVITLVPLFFLPWLVEIPAVLYIGLWFVSQLLNGVLSVVTGVQALGGVAWWAHVGGFTTGILSIKLFLIRKYRRKYYVDEYFPW